MHCLSFQMHFFSLEARTSLSSTNTEIQSNSLPLPIPGAPQAYQRSIRQAGAGNLRQLPNVAELHTWDYVSTSDWTKYWTWSTWSHEEGGMHTFWWQFCGSSAEDGNGLIFFWYVCALVSSMTAREPMLPAWQIGQWRASSLEKLGLGHFPKVQLCCYASMCSRGFNYLDGSFCGREWCKHICCLFVSLYLFKVWKFDAGWVGGSFTGHLVSHFLMYFLDTFGRLTGSSC